MVAVPASSFNRDVIIVKGKTCRSRAVVIRDVDCSLSIVDTDGSIKAVDRLERSILNSSLLWHRFNDQIIRNRYGRSKAYYRLLLSISTCKGQCSTSSRIVTTRFCCVICRSIVHRKAALYRSSQFNQNGRCTCIFINRDVIIVKGQTCGACTIVIRDVDIGLSIIDTESML